MTAKVKFNLFQRVTPNWIGSPIVDPKVAIPGGIALDAAQFPREDGVVVKVATTAAVDATSITVAALQYANGEAIPNTTIALPNGTILDFGAKKFAQLTANAMGGATSIAVENLATGLAVNDTAAYAGITKRRLVRSGTFVGRTYAERDAGTGYGVADPAADNQFALVMYDVADVDDEYLAEGYQPNAGNVVYENFLPGWTGLTTAAKAKIRSLYLCMVGNP